MLLYECLKNDILSGRLPTDTKLPSKAPAGKGQWEPGDAVRRLGNIFIRW